VASLAQMFGAGAGGDSFLGLPRVEGAAVAGADIVLIGAAGCTPYGSVGFYCADGPAAIRAAGLAYGRNLGHANFDLGGPVLPPGISAVDAGDLPQDAGDGAGNRARIVAAVGAVLDRGAVPVMIGGDDSVPIPMLQAFGRRERPIVILQIDAHIDWRDEVEGESLGLSSTMRRASEMPHVAEIVQVGQRGIGSARMSDWQDAQNWGVAFVPGGEVAREGVWRAIDLIPEGADVVVCLDLDALDPGLMPAVIGRTAGGLDYWQVLELVGGVAEKARIVGFDMVELMPERDIDGQGALLAAQLLAAILGIIARQRA
jgi:agmatinase